MQYYNSSPQPTLQWPWQLVQILLGSLRLGTIANYVSHPVMVGFCTAGEILIAVSQLKYLLGIKVRTPDFSYTPLNLTTLPTRFFRINDLHTCLRSICVP